MSMAALFFEASWKSLFIIIISLWRRKHYLISVAIQRPSVERQRHVAFGSVSSDMRHAGTSSSDVPCWSVMHYTPLFEPGSPAPRDRDGAQRAARSYRSGISVSQGRGSQSLQQQRIIRHNAVSADRAVSCQVESERRDYVQAGLLAPRDRRWLKTCTAPFQLGRFFATSVPRPRYSMAVSVHMHDAGFRWNDSSSHMLRSHKRQLLQQSKWTSDNGPV